MKNGNVFCICMEYGKTSVPLDTIGKTGAANFMSLTNSISKKKRINMILVSSGLGTVIASEFGIFLNHRFHVRNYFGELHTSENLCPHLNFICTRRIKHILRSVEYMLADRMMFIGQC